jgi:DNA-binding transcriptional ArsR family regulator
MIRKSVGTSQLPVCPVDGTGCASAGAAGSIGSKRQASGRTCPHETVSSNLRFVTTYRSDAWALLGDASRRTIIERLSRGPCSVAELADDMPISRPAVSQHLKLLREAGIVRDEPLGRQRVYSIDAARLERYRRQLDQFWSGALGNLSATTNEHEGEIG